MSLSPKMRIPSTYFITKTAMVAAAYAALTLLFAPFAYGPIQFRLSEVLCILPFFLPEAIPGLYLGCIVANLFTPNFLIADVIFGSLATLLAALCTRGCRRLPRAGKWLCIFPPVFFNAWIVGSVITYSMAAATESIPAAFVANALSVGAGELGVMLLLGLPAVMLLDQRIKHRST